MMRTEDLERLERAIEEDRLRSIEEVEKVFSRKRDALVVARALFEEYGAFRLPLEPVEDEAPIVEKAPAVEVPEAPAEPLRELEPQEAPGEEPAATSDPHDAGGSVEEEQLDEMVEALGPVPEDPEEEDGEPKKPCKECGAELPLDEYYKQPTRADGHDGTCKRCRAEQTRNRKEKRRREREGAPEPSPAEPDPDPAGKAALSRVTTLPQQKREPERSAPAPEKKDRYCRNGKGCVSYPYLGEPTKLNSGNKGFVCYKCEKKTALGSRPVGTLGPLVRKSGADREVVG